MDSHQCSYLWIAMSRALGRGEPAVVVVKKNPTSLADLRENLLAAYDRFGIHQVPTLVLDDECDDASVDSSEMPIPTAIANLWHHPSGVTPLIAYLGYTATSAANLLQSAQNELYPQHFVSLLRFPASQDTSLSFEEPNPDKWYSGGETYYEDWGESASEDENFLIREVDDEEPEVSIGLVDAVRAYLVSGAFRLAIAPDRDFSADKKIPAAHTMLVQTSPLQVEHVRWARSIQQRFGGEALPDNSFRFDAPRVMTEIDEDEGSWRKWFDSFLSSRERVYAERPHEEVHRFVTWTQVKAKMATVLDNVRLRIVNSDPGAGSALDFERRVSSDGAEVPPSDIYTIIVGGARLSRGLTIEGLCIAYFTRWNPSPTEDTVLQLSRWFGYRGLHLEFCRIFTTAHIYRSLREIHRNDTDLRYQLAELMVDHKNRRTQPSYYVPARAHGQRPRWVSARFMILPSARSKQCSAMLRVPPLHSGTRPRRWR
jgi:hypothetical protein